MQACPLCAAGPEEIVWTSELAPVYQLLGLGESAGADHFAPLEIVRCGGCGHLYNRLYSPRVAERMYRGDVISNVPVHGSMTASLREVAEWIGPDLFAGKRVVEVGAGSGYLARMLAGVARSVVVFEPSAGLTARAFPEGNIRLVPDVFSASELGAPADLVVCRQVLEHVADPMAMLTELRAGVSETGRVYVEVPRAEYIEEHAALFDLHYAHVQYFHEANLLRIAARAGFGVERSWRLKNGHDIGVLLRCGRTSDVQRAVTESVTAKELKDRLKRRRERGRQVLERLAGRVGLYGATWHGVAFLDVFHDGRRFEVVMDDNGDYAGRRLYSWSRTVPVVRPAPEVIEDLDHVIITAYLHDRVIEERLRATGFAGDVFTIRSECGEHASSTL